MSEPLHTRIERRIAAIEAWPSGDRTLRLHASRIGRIIDSKLLSQIATEAAKEAQDYYCERKSKL